MEECRICPKDGSIRALEENVKTLFKITDKTAERVDKLDEKMDSQYKLSESIAVMAEQMLGIGKTMTEVKIELGQVKRDVGELRDKVHDDRTKELEEEASYWKKYKWHIALGITSAIVSAMMTVILSGITIGG